MKKYKLINILCVPACQVRAISFSLRTLLSYEHRMSCRHLSPGGRKPISVSSVTQQSPHLPSYEFLKFNFHR
jgi:hypothetical protein